MTDVLYYLYVTAKVQTVENLATNATRRVTNADFGFKNCHLRKYSDLRHLSIFKKISYFYNSGSRTMVTKTENKKARLALFQQHCLPIRKY